MTQLVSKKLSERRLRKGVFRILNENVLCSMATSDLNNRAHANTAYFCYSNDLDLYFLSNPNSKHCQNLLRNRSMAITVFRSSQKWGGPDRGLQLFGTCSEVMIGPVWKKAERLYAKRFRLYSKWMAGTSEEDKRRAQLLRTYRFYHFRPTRFKLFDEAEHGGAVFITATVKR